MNQLGNKIEALLKLQGKKRKDLMQYIPMSAPSLSEKLQVPAKFKLMELIRIAKFLKISVSELLNEV